MRPAFFSRTVAILCTLLFGIRVLATEPFFEGLGSYSRKITTNSPRAQRYFNQGLAFLHGFNHGGHSFVPGSGTARPEMRDGTLGNRARLRTPHQPYRGSSTGGGVGVEGTPARSAKCGTS